MGSITLNLKAGRYRYPCTVTPFEQAGKLRFKLKFGFNRALMNEIKDSMNAKWNPDGKFWHVEKCPRVIFQLAYLAGDNPYEPYDRDLVTMDFVRPLREHQREMVHHMWTRRHSIIAGEMGTGKSLAAIELMERAKTIEGIQDHEIWYVGPVSGVKAVSRELVKWEAQVKPEMLTYNRLTKRIQDWRDGEPAPKVVVFDECSALKTPTSQRSMAALHLCQGMREEHGFDNTFTTLMSGTPAPKTPVDWWHQAEVACPGFLKEGNIHKFKRRLCLVENRESMAGGTYPHLVTWFDDERKCKECGQIHSGPTKNCSGFVPSKNEVSYLYDRLQGLVMVKLKKDCTDLPEKQYQTVRVKPTVDTLRLAKMIRTRGHSAIQIITLLRELSDGFQYYDGTEGEETCPICSGKGRCMQPVIPDDYDPEVHEPEMVAQICKNCDGTGISPIAVRKAHNVGSPKDDVYKELLDDHFDVGRFAVFGGFSATIDRLVTMAIEKKWHVLRVDGRGYRGFCPDGSDCDSDVLLDCMDRTHPNYKQLKYDYPNVCFVGHPKAAGMGLTLHASPTLLYYSNVYDGEARMQSEDRIHRMGMDVNRGATIIDLIHLKSDQMVLDNIKNKKRLQSLTLTEIEQAFS